MPISVQSLWTIDPAAFPDQGSAREKLAFLVGYAVLAPSGHNTQPWHFVLSDDHIDIVADMSRALKTVDPLDRELTISCAAGRRDVARSRQGVRAQGNPDAAAASRRADRDRAGELELAEPSGAVNHTMLNAIATRRTVRRAYADTAVPSHIQALIKDTARPYGVGLHLSDNELLEGPHRRARGRCRPYPVRRPRLPRRARLVDASAQLRKRRRACRAGLRLSGLFHPRRRGAVPYFQSRAAWLPAWTGPPPCRRR